MGQHLTWKNWSDAFIEETKDRESVNPKDLCNYGIKVLDDSLYKIGSNELVVIGADTGIGKSTLSLSIAQHNAKQGKKVGIYYLEGGHLEAIRRMKWRDIAQKYYNEYRFTHPTLDMDFKKWRYNKLTGGAISELEAEVNREYQEKYKDNLFIYSATKEFTLEKLLGSLADFNPQIIGDTLDVDLLIIDHLQYFSLASSENEITEITKILREVKNITEFYNTPVILISHLRKRGKNAGLPSHEDFYGSSNISKISTTSIMIAPHSQNDDMKKGIYPTFFRAVKSRTGIRPNHAFLVDFDATTNTYCDEYEIYRVNALGQPASEPIIDKPKWGEK